MKQTLKMINWQIKDNTTIAYIYANKVELGLKSELNIRMEITSLMKTEGIDRLTASKAIRSKYRKMYEEATNERNI